MLRRCFPDPAAEDIEAGLWTPEAVTAWLRSPLRRHCLRVLLELPDSSDETGTLQLADSMLEQLATAQVGQPILMHGEGTSAWPVLRHALALGLDIRIGLEDTLHLPDGQIAPDNASLVARALHERTLT